MKLTSALAASLFAIVAAISLNANAAADNQAGAKTAPDTPAAAKTENAAHQMKMRPHSHAEEKTGFVQKAPQAVPDKPNPARDWSKHFHPRDGK